MAFAEGELLIVSSRARYLGLISSARRWWLRCLVFCRDCLRVCPLSFVLCFTGYFVSNLGVSHSEPTLLTATIRPSGPCAPRECRLLFHAARGGYSRCLCDRSFFCFPCVEFGLSFLIGAIKAVSHPVCRAWWFLKSGQKYMLCCIQRKGLF